VSDLFFGEPVEPVQPSRELRSSIMDKLATTPQLARDERPTPAADRAERRWFTRPSVLFAAVAAAAALLLGGGVLWNGINDYTFQLAQADRLAAINAADDVERATVEVGEASATLVWSVEATTAALLVEGMGPAPFDKTYQLWYISEDGARPAGTFSVSPDGEAWRVLDGDMAAGDTVGVTIEPRGGSDTPSGDPIMTIES
jgi:anti-sigma-K factor RskA